MRHVSIILAFCFLMSSGCQEKYADVPGTAVPADVEAEGLVLKSSGGTVSNVSAGTTLRFLLFDMNNLNLVTNENGGDVNDGTGTYIMSDDVRTLRPCQLDDNGNPVLTDGRWNEDKKYSLRVSQENITNHAVLVSPGRMYSVKTDGTGRVVFPLDASKPEDHAFYVSASVPLTVSDYRIYLKNIQLSPVFSKVKVNVFQSDEKTEQQNYSIKDSRLILKNTSVKGEYYPNHETVDFVSDSYEASLSYDSASRQWSTGDIYLFAGNYSPDELGALGLSFTLLVEAEGEGGTVTAEMPVNMSVSQTLKRAGYYVYDILWTSESVILKLTTRDWVEEPESEVVVDGEANTQVIGQWSLDGSWINGGGGVTEI